MSKNTRELELRAQLVLKTKIELEDYLQSLDNLIDGNTPTFPSIEYGVVKFTVRREDIMPHLLSHREAVARDLKSVRSEWSVVMDELDGF